MHCVIGFWLNSEDISPLLNSAKSESQVLCQCNIFLAKFVLIVRLCYNAGRSEGPESGVGRIYRVLF